MEGQKLTEHFSLNEFTRSSVTAKHGICNEPPVEAISNLQNLCQEVLEPLREHYGKPIIISSGYRYTQLNRLVGGARHSQHLTGEACDLHLPSIKIGLEWFDWLQCHCPFDQLIWEQRLTWIDAHPYLRCWIHISCRRKLDRNRKQVLVLKK